MAECNRIWPRRVAFGFASAGMAIVLLTCLWAGMKGEHGYTAIIGLGLFAAWGLVPYGIICFGHKLTSNPWVLGGAGASALAAEIGYRASVFLWPQSSTQAIALAFSPILIVVIFIPAGAALGWLMGWLWRFKSRTLRTTVVAVSAAIWGLTVLGLARPELFPTSVYSREQAQTQLGEPRVVVGDGSFEKTLVSTSAWAPWYVAAELDGSPGEEVAVFRSDVVEVLDPADFRIKNRLRIVRGHGPLLSGSETLARIDGRLLIVRQGGGYQPTEVRSLGGELVWAYRPDESPPPAALLPADLDGDGTIEFYAAASTVERLDGTGKPVWSRDARPYELVLAARTGTEPAWVVGYEYHRPTKVWDENGNLLGELPQIGKDEPVAVVDRPDGRGLLLKGNVVRVVSIDGHDLFRFPLEGLAVRFGLSVRFHADEDPHLVVVAGAPRDVERWRLLIWGADQDPVYDEVFDTDRPPNIFKARRGDGAETLFLWRDDLHALRPLS
ncbi:MAG: hypothetical protein OXI90_06525 [Gammaproteobacteria bacterium]|nr:hypothetical protein [Gammaproteobacteria bacterium]